MAPKAPRLGRDVDVPSRLNADDLTITWKPDRMVERVIDLNGWPGSRDLRLQVAAGITSKVSEGGTWHSAAGVALALNWVRRFLSWCDEAGVDGLEQLTPTLVDQFEDDMRDVYAERSAFVLIANVRSVLLDSQGLPTHTGWRLRERRVTPAPRGLQAHYSIEEFRNLERTAHRAVSKARRRIERNYRLATRPVEGDGAERQQAMAQLLNGPEGLTAAQEQLLGRPSPVAAGRNVTVLNHLFMTADEALAAGVLLVCREGFNLSPLNLISTGDDSATVGDDETIYTVHVDKARRHTRRHSTVTMANGRASGGAKSWGAVERATAPARAYLAKRGVPTDRLLIFAATDMEFEDPDRVPWPGLRFGVPNGKYQRINAKWLPGGAVVHFPKLRRTVLNLVTRSPTQNTAATHIKDYLLHNEEVREELAQGAADGLKDALRHAEERLVLRLAQDEHVPPDIASGSKDTATVACKDILHHPVTGQACVDNFLTCLMCSNAVATVRHLPRLVLIHQALSDLRSTLTDRAWERWRDDYLRLTAFLYERARLDETSYAEYLAAASQQDRKHVERLLGGTYDAAT